MTEEEINNFDLSSIRKDSPEGYILEVDLEYPIELHNYFDDYPPAPEKLKVTNDMLSKYCSDIANKHGIRVGEVNKLIPNLGNKKNYVIHYRNLQLYISLGMKVTKFHKILKFKQSDWMKKYIDFNTEKRKNANNNYEKNFFKLMINSVYGKTMENLRKIVNVKLINNAKDYVKSVSRPTFVSQKIFNKNLVAIHKIKPILLLNKPIYVGFSVLELSKLLMYDFHYNYFKEKYNARLLFTDTDSLVYEIKRVYYIYERIYSEHLFDFSNYPENSKFYDDTNIKVIGKMKDEMCGKVVSEFVGLKSKMYSLITIDDVEKIRAKGINTKLKHGEFVDVLDNKKTVRHNMKRIQHKRHRLRTYNISKISLSCFDDKRYILDDGEGSHSYYHKDINS